MPTVTGKPLVSVIIPAYNHEKFVGAAIASVLQQTVADLELIVIDDGSTDNTGAIVKAYADPRLAYYFQENRDAYNTINRGLSLAKGQYVAILNSDDVYTLDRLAKLLEFCRERAAACVFTDVVPISDSGEVFADPDFGWNIWHKKNRDYYFASGDIYRAFLKGNFMVTTSNLFMTAKAMRTVGNFCSLRYLHDYDFIFRMMLAFPGGVHYLDSEKLLFYRIHAGNTLGEAAVIGREQDQMLIARYMAAKVPQELRDDVTAGAERLIELGRELHEVQMMLAHGKGRQPQGVRPALKNLMESLRIWMNKQLPQRKRISSLL